MATFDMDATQNAVAPAVAAATMAQASAAAAAASATLSVMPPVKLSTLNATAGALPAGAITGAHSVTLVSTNAAPGTQISRSETAMIADASIVAPLAYELRIVNRGAGTFELAGSEDGSVTLGAGTYTILQNKYRDFVVEFPTADSCVITTVGAGTWS